MCTLLRGLDQLLSRESIDGGCAAEGLGTGRVGDTCGVRRGRDCSLNLDFTSVALPGILCARKGAMRSMFSASRSAVDFTVRADAVLDSNEGGPATVTALVRVSPTLPVGSVGGRGRAIDWDRG